MSKKVYSSVHIEVAFVANPFALRASKHLKAAWPISNTVWCSHHSSVFERNGVPTEMVVLLLSSSPQNNRTWFWSKTLSGKVVLINLLTPLPYVCPTNTPPLLYRCFVGLLELLVMFMEYLFYFKLNINHFPSRAIQSVKVTRLYPFTWCNSRLKVKFLNLKKNNKSREGKEALCLTGGLGLSIQPFAHSRMATWYAHSWSQNLSHVE